MQADDDARLAKLESQVAYLLAYLGVDPSAAGGDWSAAGPMRSGPLPGDFIDDVPRPGPIGGPMPSGAMPGGGVPPQVANAIIGGKLIQAIKIYRSLTGLSLKDAKAQVDAWAAEMGMPGGRGPW